MGTKRPCAWAILAGAIFIQTAAFAAGGDDDMDGPTAPFNRQEAPCPASLRPKEPRTWLGRVYRDLFDKALVWRMKPTHRKGSWREPFLHFIEQDRFRQGLNKSGGNLLVERYPVGTYARFRSAYNRRMAYDGVIVEYTNHGDVLIQAESGMYALLNPQYLDLAASRPNWLDDAEAAAVRVAGASGVIRDRILDDEEYTLRLRSIPFRGRNAVFMTQFSRLNLQRGEGITVFTRPARDGAVHSFSGSYQGFTKDGENLVLHVEGRSHRLVAVEALDPQAFIRMKTDYLALRTNTLVVHVDARGHHTLGFYQGYGNHGDLLFQQWSDAEGRSSALRDGSLANLSQDSLVRLLKTPAEAKPTDPGIVQSGFPKGHALIVQLPRETIDGYYLGVHEIAPIATGGGLEQYGGPGDTRREVWIYNRATGHIEEISVNRMRKATVLAP